MTKLQWDLDGERRYETGVDRGVLYLPTNGVYDQGFAWNGLTTVTESPSGAEPTPMYADNIKYLNLLSREDFMATVEAYTYPTEFELCDGTAKPTPGVALSQQRRVKFGMCYRTKLGNDDLATDFGYKLHLIYGALAAPSEKAYATVNDTPEAITFSWSLSTTEVNVAGYKPTALVTIDSTQVNAANLTALEDILYGTAGVNPRLPSPDEVIALFAGSVTTVSPATPTYNSSTHVITIPTTTGVVYKIDGVTKTGTVTLTAGQTKVVRAYPAAGYVFPAGADDDNSFTY